MTSGFTPAWVRAGPMMRANSRSVITTLASPWSRQKAMIAASSRVLRVLSTAPAIGTP